MVWFQAWRYNDTDSILAPLIYTILDNMRSGDLGKQFQGFFEQVKQSIDPWRVPAVLLKTLGFDLSDVQQKPQYVAKASFYEDFRDTFRSLLYVYLNDLRSSFRDNFGKEIDDEKTILVVFVDERWSFFAVQVSTLR